MLYCSFNNILCICYQYFINDSWCWTW